MREGESGNTVQSTRLDDNDDDDETNNLYTVILFQAFQSNNINLFTMFYRYPKSIFNAS